jgi:hypothetical protein
MASKYPNLYHRLVAHTSIPDGQLESTGCWEHDAPLSRPVYGYPRIAVWRENRHVKRLVHVLMFEIIHGPVPEGHEVDHICHNARCCNPDHLQALPARDNRLKNRGLFSAAC